MAGYDQCDATCTTDCGTCKGQGKPVGGRYEAAKKVVETKQFNPDFEGRILDLFTASAMVAVYPHLSPANQARFDTLPLETVTSFCLKAVGR